MRSCRRELATKGNLDGAEGGISYSLLGALLGNGIMLPKVHGGTLGFLLQLFIYKKSVHIFK